MMKLAREGFDMVAEVWWFVGEEMGTSLQEESQMNSSFKTGTGAFGQPIGA
jgi:hypothetical protein